MTDEWYKKKRLEEMQKQTALMERQTECMVNILKLLADIRDVGHMINIAFGVLDDSVIDKVSDKVIRHADGELRRLSDSIEKRWSE